MNRLKEKYFSYFFGIHFAKAEIYTIYLYLNQLSFEMKDKDNTKLYIIIPILIGMIIPFSLYFYFWGIEKKDKNFLSNAVEISNQPLPKSTLFDVKENVDFSEKIRKGKVLLIFLSPNCPACKKDVETISKVYPKILSELQIYGVSIESNQDMMTFISEKEIQFPVLIDKNSELFNKLQINYFPSKYLIENGVILKSMFGNFVNEQKMIEELNLSRLE